MRAQKPLRGARNGPCNCSPMSRMVQVLSQAPACRTQTAQFKVRFESPRPLPSRLAWVWAGSHRGSWAWVARQRLSCGHARETQRICVNARSPLPPRGPRHLRHDHETSKCSSTGLSELPRNSRRPVMHRRFPSSVDEQGRGWEGFVGSDGSPSGLVWPVLGAGSGRFFGCGRGVRRGVRCGLWLEWSRGGGAAASVGGESGAASLAASRWGFGFRSVGHVR